MPRDPETFLFDALDSTRFLLEFAQSRSLDDLRDDRGFRSAVERELQIIGEAIMQLDKTAPELTRGISEKSRIIGFRHVLVHGYYTLDHDIVWAVIVDKLPTLEQELQMILDERSGAGNP